MGICHKGAAASQNRAVPRSCLGSSFPVGQTGTCVTRLVSPAAHVTLQPHQLNAPNSLMPVGCGTAFLLGEQPFRPACPDELLLQDADIPLPPTQVFAGTMEGLPTPPQPLGRSCDERTPAAEARADAERPRHAKVATVLS